MLSNVLLALLLCAGRALAHVSLTFPEARFPPLDFLDTARTLGPCGVPKSDRSVYSTLKTGQKYNVTWRLQYPHQGGFRLSLIDYLGNLVEELAPTGGGTGSAGNGGNGNSSSSRFEGAADQSREWHEVRPRSACPNCTLVLERQALEWGPSYRFRSCAEVHVLEEGAADGAAEPAPACQQRGAAEPRPEGAAEGQCACRAGFSGPLCQFEDDCALDTDCANGGRCLQDAIFPNKKSCFCPLGFFGRRCAGNSAPALAGDPCVRLPGAEPNNASLKYGLFDEHCFRRHELGPADLLYSRLLGEELELLLDFQTESYVALGWRPAGIPKTCRLFPDLSRSGDGEQAGVKTAGFTKTALDSALHAMDCTDVVMASVLDGDLLHIRDMYTRDRSTPLLDEQLDGEQSLTAALGLQREGRTLVLFRRGVREIEPSDHPLGPGKVHLIHAKGQTQGAYKHISPSALEKDTVGNKDFYKNDQWRYHGSENRGVHRVEFVSAAELADSRRGSAKPAPVLKRPTPAGGFRDEVLPRPTSTPASPATAAAGPARTQGAARAGGNTSEQPSPAPAPSVAAPGPGAAAGAGPAPAAVPPRSQAPPTTSAQLQTTVISLFIALFCLR